MRLWLSLPRSWDPGASCPLMRATFVRTAGSRGGRFETCCWGDSLCRRFPPAAPGVSKFDRASIFRPLHPEDLFLGQRHPPHSQVRGCGASTSTSGWAPQCAKRITRPNRRTLELWQIHRPSHRAKTGGFQNVSIETECSAHFTGGRGSGLWNSVAPSQRSPVGTPKCRSANSSKRKDTSNPLRGTQRVTWQPAISPRRRLPLASQ